MKRVRTITKTVDRLNSDTLLKSFMREGTTALKKCAHSTFQVCPLVCDHPRFHQPLVRDLLLIIS
jgi:hypothetical protein